MWHCRESWTGLEVLPVSCAPPTTIRFPLNYGIGHGWVEGGPLLPVMTEYYQSALGTEALRALSHLGDCWQGRRSEGSGSGIPAQTIGVGSGILVSREKDVCLRTR